jgi:cellulose synthase/poly-beta-1,6-N-acetylglucosamine synthase-like glycosyltransferase
MRVAVITPYYREPLDVLERCHGSVAAQTYPCTHIMVADGHPQSPVDTWQETQHFSLPICHGDYGNTPRSLGSISAFNQGFDAVAYLDADNWYAEEHVETLVEALRTNPAAVAFSFRQIMLKVADGLEPLPGLEAGERNATHVDTNCYLITKEAAYLAPVWALMDPRFAAVGDRVIRRVIRDRLPSIVCTGKKTVFYLSRWPQHYKAVGRPVPADAHEVKISPDDSDPYDPSLHLARLGFDPFA